MYNLISHKHHPNFVGGYFSCNCSKHEPDQSCLEVADRVILFPIFSYLFDYLDVTVLANEIYEHVQENRNPFNVEKERMEKLLAKKQKQVGYVVTDMLNEDRETVRSVLRTELAKLKEQISSLEHQLQYDFSKEEYEPPSKADIICGLEKLNSDWTVLSKRELLNILYAVIDNVHIVPDGNDFLITITWAFDDRFSETLWVERSMYFQKQGRWSKQDLDFIENNLHLSNRELVAKFPGYTIETIKTAPYKIRGSRAKAIRKKIPEIWAPEEDEFLRQYANHELTYTQIRKNVLPYRPHRSIKIRLQQLQLPLVDSKVIYWRLMSEKCQFTGQASTSPSHGQTSPCRRLAGRWCCQS